MALSKTVAEQTLEVLVDIRDWIGKLSEQTDNLQQKCGVVADKAAIAELRQCQHMAQGAHLLYIKNKTKKTKKKQTKKEPKAPTPRV